MENQKIIIALLCVIVAILVVGVVIFSPLTAKENTSLEVPDKEINVGDSLAVKLTDSKGNPISNATVNIRFTDKDGTVIDEDVTTNSKGVAKLKMDDEGKYCLNCSFKGDGHYSSSEISTNVTVKTVKTEVVSAAEKSPSQSSEREEYKITPDGWDPKEHEVSREKLDNGYERVNYDDGYMRVVDKDGNIITHGW